MGPSRRRCLIAAALILCGLTGPVDGSVVSDWDAILLQAIRTGAVPPPVAARAMAITHVAVYDALNSIDRGHRPYLVQLAAAPGTSPDAAAAQAAYRALVNLFPAQAPTFDAARAASLAAVPDGPGKVAGTTLGDAAAAAILAARAADGSTASVPYTPGGAPGQWRPTPPGLQPALLPQWPAVTPFGMTGGSDFRAPAPPALGSHEYATALNEVKALGSATSSIRIADQTQIAQFWSDGAGTVTPPGHWNQIAQAVATAWGLSVTEEARLFALLDLAMADAAIVAWDTKYAYDLWRPITAIRLADTDGNPATDADPSWTPLLATPPFSTYTSGHSTFSGAAAEILGQFFGTDAIAFSSTSDGLSGVVRSFSGFREAAEEAGRSRIYGGIHFQFDNEPGLAAGRALGNAIYADFLTPVPEPASLALLGLGIAIACAWRYRHRPRAGVRP